MNTSYNYRVLRATKTDVKSQEISSHDLSSIIMLEQGFRTQSEAEKCAIDFTEKYKTKHYVIEVLSIVDTKVTVEVVDARPKPKHRTTGDINGLLG